MENLLIYFFLLFSVIFDFWKFKIKNFITYPFILLGIIYSTWKFGFYGLWHAILSLVIVFFVFLIPYFLKMGAGDIKLLMGISTYMGYYTTIYIGLYAFVLGAILFIITTPPKKLVLIFKNLFYLIFYKIPLLSDRGGYTKRRFALPILIAFFLVANGYI